jgi:membrane-associated phospholipid phosphatase
VRPGAPSETEVDELLAMQRERTTATNEVVKRWDRQPAVLPWTNMALDMIKAAKPSPPRVGRGLALLHVAMADTMAAVEDARRVWRRPAPSVSIAGLTNLTATVDAGSSFPSEHAAIAGAAAAVLSYLYPDEATRLAEAKEESATSRLWAGANYRSDIAAGLALGEAVGALAIARGSADGSDAIWDKVRPTGEGTWQPTPPQYVTDPLEPVAGRWRPWVLSSGDALRPPPPPAWDSPAWQAELLAVQEAVARRTPEQEEAVLFWAGGPGTVTPAGLWIEIARDLIVRDELDTQAAAHALALTSVAMADAFICCWDAKYTYWLARPVTADPTLHVQIPTPPFPSYTSGHSTISAAAATALGHLFPADEADLTAMAAEAKDSRLWSGIHYPIDNDMGALGGGMVGRLVIARVHGSEAEGGGGT